MRASERYHFPASAVLHKMSTQKQRRSLVVVELTRKCVRQTVFTVLVNTEADRTNLTNSSVNTGNVLASQERK